MTEPAQAASGVARFLESFLHERNIKWLLATGLLILLGSSLLLVTQHWREITPAWKGFVFLGYTGLVYGAGCTARFRLALPRTGICLLALTTLLVPVNFLCVHWLRSESAAGFVERIPGQAALLAALGVFAWYSSRRIFDHFLRTPQPTLRASYLILCLAGTLAPAVPPALAPWAALVLWTVFAAGVVKSARHVFWLAEEHRLPRIAGFFPVALLGAQFLGIVCSYFAPAIPLEWVGFGLALAALPILFTADAAARVFEERTGGLVKPMPLAVSAPFGLGLALSAASLVLAGSNLLSPGRNPLALTPAAAVITALMAVTARRTRKQAFVWAMLGALTVAYNFSPAFFRDAARHVVSWGASTVKEAALPYAFYGLTYLPLVAGLGLVGSRLQRRGDAFFAPVIAKYRLGLTAALLALGWLHPKALLPVGVALCAVCSLDALRSRGRVATILASLSLATAGLGAPTFGAEVLGWPYPLCFEIYTLGAAAAAILVSSHAVDRTSSRWIAAFLSLGIAVEWLFAMHTSSGFRLEACLSAGLVTALLAACAALLPAAWLGGAATLFWIAAWSKALHPILGLDGALLGCAIAGAAAIPVRALLERRARRLEARNLDGRGWRALTSPMAWVSTGVLALVSFGSLLSFSPIIRATGFVALGGLVLATLVESRPSLRSLAWIPANWQALWLLVRACAPGAQGILSTTAATIGPALLPLALGASVSLAVYQRSFARHDDALGATALVHRWALRGCAAAALALSLTLPGLDLAQTGMAAGAFALLAASEVSSARRHQSVERAWAAEAAAGAGVVYLAWFDVIRFGHGVSSYVLLGSALAFLGCSSLAARRPEWAVLSGPFRRTALALPLGVVALAAWKHVSGAPVQWLGSNSLALLGAGAFYFWRGIEERRKAWIVLSGAVLNAALAILWRELDWSSPQLYLVPLGITVLGFVELLKEQIPRKLHDPLRYAGALTILVSPLFHILDGSWVHFFTLLVSSTLVVLLAIGLRARALLYTGTTFLTADLAGMVVRSSIDNRNILWITGLGLGALVVALAALCESRREAVMNRVRVLTAVLRSWN